MLLEQLKDIQKSITYLKEFQETFYSEKTISGAQKLPLSLEPLAGNITAMFGELNHVDKTLNLMLSVLSGADKKVEAVKPLENIKPW